MIKAAKKKGKYTKAQKKAIRNIKKFGKPSPVKRSSRKRRKSTKRSRKRRSKKRSRRRGGKASSAPKTGYSGSKKN